MPKLMLGGKQIEVDEDGFIKEPALWDQNVARDLAKAEGVQEMSERHWKLVNYLRGYYQKFGIAPTARTVSKEHGLALKEIYEMFPSGLSRGACKIAGLPKPTGCV